MLTGKGGEWARGDGKKRKNELNAHHKKKKYCSGRKSTRKTFPSGKGEIRS